MYNDVKNFFKDVFSINDAKATKDEIKERIIQNSKLKGPNMCGLIFAIILASIGLNIDSLTVAIGAMLISPLMGGIQGIGYALATLDIRYFKRVLVGFLIEILLCIATSTIYFLVTPISTESSSLLQMYSPKIWDAIIAFVAGLAGIIALTRKGSTGTVLPGVAVACSIILPLCRTGYAITTLNFEHILKSLYLFFINAFFICLTAIIVVKILKIPKRRVEGRKDKIKIFVELTIIGVLTVVPSSYFAYEAVNQTILEKNVNKYIASEFNFEKTQVVKSVVDTEKNQVSIALIGNILSDEEIKKISDKKKDYKIENIDFKITQTYVNNGVSPEELQEIKEELSSLKSLVSDKSSLNYDKTKISDYLKKEYSQIENCGISSTKILNSDSQNYESSIVVTLTLNKRVSPEEIIKVKDYLKEQLKTDKFEIQYVFNN